MGKIRIIGGKWRGRQLPVLDQIGLRPTSDRIRETLFNWLMPIIQNSHCLDCFSGSGALGFEAASRYADKVVLLEKNPLIVKQLKNNVNHIDATEITVQQTDTVQWLKNSPSDTFNVVFLDPPFKQNLLAQVVTLLENQKWLAQNAWIYVECELNEANAIFPDSWQLHREIKTKEVYARLYIRHKD